MIALALSTQIPMSEWESAGSRAIATAWELLQNANDKAKANAEGRT